jgi:polyisoprenoid-binding protein YceI
MMTRTFLFAALAALAAACAKDPTSGKQQAAVAEPRAEAPASAATETVTLSPANTKIGYVGAKVTAQHRGGFATFAGTASIVDGAPEKSRVEVEIDVASITEEEDNQKLLAHLKSPDFFDVARHPRARFVSTEIRNGSDVAGATHTVTGNLELRGVTKSVTFPATIAITPEAVKVNAEFGINRHDWAISYPGMQDDLIKDNVLLSIAIAAPRSADKS